MKLGKTLKLATMASIAVLALAACSDTTISSPGTSTPPASPPPPPPPPPPAASTIDLIPTAGCPTGTTATTFDAVAQDGFSDVDVCVLGSDAAGGTSITTDIEIPANITIAIQGPVFIGEDNKDDAGTPATLKINEGVRFFGASAAGTATATDDYLVVTRGSKIEAVGTEANPIRFTARAALNDEETGSSLLKETTNAQWGGLVLNGFAPINACDDGTATGGTAACEKVGEGSSGRFGGSIADDNSGTLQYVIVEYAGSRLTNNDELNGIAFQGVGSGTTVDHIQVHNNLDDGIEWFGGTVSAKYVAITGAGDDSLDWTDGWTGKLQYAAVRSNIPSSGDPRGIEADNLSGDPDKTPFSDPSISNFTLVGTENNDQGVLLRRGTKGRVINGIVVGYGSGLDIDNSDNSTQTTDNYADGSLVVESILLDTANNIVDDGDTPAIKPGTNIVGRGNSLTDGFFPGTAELTVPVSTALAGDAFFDTTTYIGAFAPTETLASNWANFTLPGTLFEEVEATCPAGTTTNGELAGKTLCVISGSKAITADLRLSNGDKLIYELDGSVFVGVDLGPDPAAPLGSGVAATLTIDPGVTIVGAGNDDYLVVTRGSKIFSNGTAQNPVVFTAKGDIDGTATIDQDTKGLWGGVVLNGRAPINACEDGTATGGTVDCEKSGEGSSGLFGGATADDDSGQLFYTRVQYAGVALTNEDELNGIAFQGVGSGTEVDYVQVYNNFDDCFEWFGGTVSASHLVGLGCGDDTFDWTDGWKGSLQYAIAYTGVASATGGISSSHNGIEADSSSNAAATPISSPNVSNFTIISGGDDNALVGALIRRNMQGVLANGIILGWPEAGIDIDGTDTQANFNNGDLIIQSLFLADNGKPVQDSDGDDVTFTAANDVETALPSTMSGFAFRAGRPGIVPGASENSVDVYDVTGLGDLEATTYIGAVKDANDKWFLGWTIDQQGNLTSAN
ncbi:hypothetical protein [Hyphomonas pacifica]|uniref:Lipoprotein n=1 Tax=Hyphomonas pacifica TaxID=1280941 RepID=A0A062TWQ0_9PROT|nr:hypothetical protein [Hyphomonas pacifica]KCZ50452.1 hypothetical protein HY2_13645 [Hyphomonas pacifica]RAN33888.1 hypothetical protein HY3_12015 [Hyphomonas pacifica]